MHLIDAFKEKLGGYFAAKHQDLCITALVRETKTVFMKTSFLFMQVSKWFLFRMLIISCGLLNLRNSHSY